MAKDDGKAEKAAAHEAPTFDGEFSNFGDPEFRKELEAFLDSYMEARSDPAATQGPPVQNPPYPVEVFEAAVRLASKCEERLKEKYEWQWKSPYVAFGIVCVLATLFFGVNLVSQWWTLAEVRHTSDALRSEVDESKTARTTLGTAQQQLSTDVTELRNDYESAIRAAEETRSLAIASNASALRLVSLTALARDQLVSFSDPKRSLYYAGLAEDEVATAMDRLGVHERNSSNQGVVQAKPDEGPIDTVMAASLDRLASGLWVVTADAHLQLDDLHHVKEYAERILASDCECLEGHLFKGLAYFHEGSRLDDNFSRKRSLTVAIDHLKKAHGDDDRSFSHVYLAAALADVGEFEDALSAASCYVDAFDTTLRPRLNSRIQAQIQIGEAWKAVGRLLSKGEDDIGTDFTCQIDVGAVGTIDGMLFERLFRKMFENRHDLTRELQIPDSRAAHALGWVCVNTIEALRRARCTDEDCPGGVCAPGSDRTQQLAARYGLRILESLPPLSSDRDLGEWQGDNVRMNFVLPKVETLTIQLEENGKHREVTVELETFEIKQRVFAPEEQIPLRRYFAADDPPFAPVPTEEDEEPSPPGDAPAPPAENPSA